MDTRGRILQAARASFLSEGIAGVSMRRVASAVGISATAIYRHFANKDALLDAISEEGFDQLEKYLRRAPADASPIARIRALVYQLTQFSFDHPNHYDFIFIIPRKNVRHFPDDFAARRSKTFNLLVHEVQEGIEIEELTSDDPLELSLTIWAHFHGLIALQRAGRFRGKREDFYALCERSLQRLLNGVRR